MKKNIGLHRPSKSVQNKFMNPSNMKLKKGENTHKYTARGDLDREQNSIEENNAIYDQYE
jgi:hypothetical protein